MYYQNTWTNSLLREYIQFSNGKPLESQIDSNGDVNLITLDSVDISGKLKNIHKRIKKANGSLFPGDIVTVLSTVVADLNQGNLLGMSAIIPNDGTQYVLNQRMGRIRVVNESLRSDFLRLCLNASRKHFAERAQGTSQKHIYARDFFSLPIQIPPLEEQKAIAEVLSDVDELIAQTERLIAKKEAIKTGVMQELLRPKEGWSTYLVDDVAVVQGGGTPSTSIPEYWGGQINWFTPTEVGSKKYLVESERKITEKGLSRSSAKVLPAGTILFTSRAGIGDLGILTNEAATNQGFQSLIVKTDFHNEFIYYLLQTKKSEFLKYSSGSTFLEISPTSLKSVLLETPTKEKQHQIAQAISDIDEELSAMEAKAEKYRQLKSALMDQLLTGKTRLV